MFMLLSRRLKEKQHSLTTTYVKVGAKFFWNALWRKGPTIRKVMGGGGRGIFEPQEFFSLSNSLYEFFLGHSMSIF